MTKKENDLLYVKIALNEAINYVETTKKQDKYEVIHNLANAYSIVHDLLMQEGTK